GRARHDEWPPPQPQPHPRRPLSPHAAELGLPPGKRRPPPATAEPDAPAPRGGDWGRPQGPAGGGDGGDGGRRPSPIPSRLLSEQEWGQYDRTAAHALRGGGWDVGKETAVTDAAPRPGSGPRQGTGPAPGPGAQGWAAAESPRRRGPPSPLPGGAEDPSPRTRPASWGQPPPQLQYQHQQGQGQHQQLHGQEQGQAQGQGQMPPPRRHEHAQQFQEWARDHPPGSSGGGRGRTGRGEGPGWHSAAHGQPGRLGPGPGGGGRYAGGRAGGRTSGRTGGDGGWAGPADAGPALGLEAGHGVRELGPGPAARANAPGATALRAGARSLPAAAAAAGRGGAAAPARGRGGGAANGTHHAAAQPPAAAPAQGPAAAVVAPCAAAASAAAAAAAIEPAGEAAEEWWYVDPSGRTQGPCSIRQFRSWIKYLAQDESYKEEYNEFRTCAVWRQGAEAAGGRTTLAQLLMLLQ
ncbi:hypothetical protein TSOC_015035, partial [Tetrabaena socialis]